MNDRLAFLLPGLLLLGLALGSCVSLSREFPEVRLYTLDPVRELAASPAASASPTLAVLAFTTSPANTEASFLLRRDGSQVERDFYNRFVVPPAKLLQDQAASWLRDGRLFSEVRTNPDVGATDWILSGHLLRLEGDFSTSPAEAVVAVQFHLRPGAGREGERFFHAYEQRLPIASASAPSLAEGWNRAYAAILADLESDLATHLSTP